MECLLRSDRSGAEVLGSLLIDPWGIGRAKNGDKCSGERWFQVLS
jgi:hypothetical protein